MDRKITIYVAYVEGKVKGIFTSISTNQNQYWDTLKQAEVWENDWRNEKINCSNIVNYIK